MLQTRVAPAAAHARAGDAAHRGHRRRRRRKLLTDLTWTESLPARRAALADRPGAVLERRHQPAGAAADPPLAQPRVRAQRRPRAAGRCSRSSAALDGRQRRLRVVAVRPPGRDARPRLRRSASGSSPRSCCRAVAACDEALTCAPEGAVRARRRVRHLRRHGAAAARQRLHRACYVCAITLGIRRPDIRGYFEQRAEDIVEIVKLGIFVVFGVAADLRRAVRRRLGGGRDRGRHAARRAAGRGVHSRWPGTRPDTATTRRSWPGSGPKGVATMTFSLLVLSERSPTASGSSTSRRSSVFVLDHRPRADRHAGRELDRAPHRGARARFAAARGRAVAGPGVLTAAP